MPKLKTHSGAKKRFKFTKNGKVKRPHAFISHQPELKSRKRKRNLRGTAVAHDSNMKALRLMMPYH
ncbi:MAG: 50S ribosomal protein L35 [Oscillospiraceae bacterium]|jgi:large subunit ribosomal protein L35|nr:50S ribosomal protein L35 [Oscillospiraceae bacterium]